MEKKHVCSQYKRRNEEIVSERARDDRTGKHITEKGTGLQKTKRMYRITQHNSQRTR